MAIELEYAAPLGQRIKRGSFWGITSDRGDLWWHEEKKTWGPCGPGTSSHASCRSEKAFRRHLRKHQEELRGHTMILVSRYVDYDIYGTVE